jgi:hypothetical protein
MRHIGGPNNSKGYSTGRLNAATDQTKFTYGR